MRVNFILCYLEKKWAIPIFWTDMLFQILEYIEEVYKQTCLSSPLQYMLCRHTAPCMCSKNLHVTP